MAEPIEFIVETPDDIELRMEELRIIHAVSPSAVVERIENGIEVTITDVNGTTVANVYDGPKGDPGEDYVLTEEDQQQLARTMIDDTAVSSAAKTWSIDKITSEISDFVKKTDYATSSNAGIVRVTDTYGLKMVGDYIGVVRATNEDVKSGAGSSKPIVPAIQHQSVFYGLAAAAGDSTQKNSGNAVGIYTNGAKAAIQFMLDVPSKTELNSAISEVEQRVLRIHICSSSEYNAQTGVPTVTNPDPKTFYLVPGGDASNLYIEWIYLYNRWEQFGSATIDLSNYVQFDDYATSSKAGVLKAAASNGLKISNGFATIQTAIPPYIKAGENGFQPITPSNQHEATFYGLAKAAGDTTQSQSNNAVGTYTSEAKAAIQTMLDVPAKADIPEVPVQDVQVNGASVLQNGIANVPIADGSTLGVVKVSSGKGIEINTANQLQLVGADDGAIKAAADSRKPITPLFQHSSTFYGLAKAAGDITQVASNNAIGTYTDEAKTAIHTMLGIENGAEVVRLI